MRERGQSLWAHSLSRPLLHPALHELRQEAGNRIARSCCQCECGPASTTWPKNSASEATRPDTGGKSFTAILDLRIVQEIAIVGGCISTGLEGHSVYVQLDIKPHYVIITQYSNIMI